VEVIVVVRVWLEVAVTATGVMLVVVVMATRQCIYMYLQSVQCNSMNPI
jgi:hypothetical protein